MNSNFVDNFPSGFKPNTKQAELLPQIEEAFKTNKFVICCAPTGVGKSMIAKTLGNVSEECTPEFKELIYTYDAFRQEHGGEYSYEADCLMEPPFGAFALTITKSLQDQYLELFDDSSVLKGRSNYICAVDSDFDVDTAPCLLTPKMREECWSCNKCTYYNARNETLTDKFGILNYKMFLSLPEHVKKKNYIICDEASELEDTLVGQFSLTIDPDKLKIAGIKVLMINKTDHDTANRWLSNLCVTVKDEVDMLLEKLQSKKSKLPVNSDRTKINYLKSIHGNIKTVLENWNVCEYVIQKTDNIIKFTPLKVDCLTKYIFDHADKVLLMSATIIDVKTFAKTLGIKDYVYIEASSSFDPKKAPIHISTKLKLNHANLQTNLPHIVKQIEQICAAHRGEKGIIHTHSMAITKYVEDNIKGNRFLFRSDGQRNEAILQQHSESTEDTVLVTPSMVFGVDLKDELARFQIVVKAAYPPLGDLRIKTMFDLDKQWYTDKMLGNLVQACGRGVRSEKDHCTTYILDGCIYDAIMRNKENMPKHFLDRFV